MNDEEFAVHSRRARSASANSGMRSICELRISARAAAILQPPSPDSPRNPNLCPRAWQTRSRSRDDHRADISHLCGRRCMNVATAAVGRASRANTALLERDLLLRLITRQFSGRNSRVRF